MGTPYLNSRSAMMYMLSTMAVICGLLGLILSCQYIGDPISAVPLSIMIIAGTVSASLQYRKRDRLVSITVIGSAIGLCIALLGCIIFWNSITSDIENPYYIVNVLCFLMMVFGLLILYSSIRLAKGHMRNGTRLAVYLAVPIVLILMDLLYSLLHDSHGLLRIASERYYLIPPFILSVLFETILFQSGLVDRSSLAKIAYDVEQLRSSISTPHDAKMSREDLSRILGCLEDNGWDAAEWPFDRQTTVAIGKGEAQRTLIMTRLTSDHRILITIRPERCEGCIDPFCFELSDILPINGTFSDCLKVRFFGRDGLFIDILISDGI